MANAISKKLAKIIRDNFPGDMGRTIRAAIKNGTEWRYEPECAESGSAVAEQCGESDCSVGWHKYFRETGFSVCDGVLCIDLWSCDSDGDWDIVYSVDMTSTEYETFAETTFAEEQKSWIEYSKHVARTGEDPLDEFMITTTRTVRWSFMVGDGKFGITLVKLRRNGGEYMPLSKAPEALRDFFRPDDLKEFASVEELQERSRADIQWMPVKLRGGHIAKGMVLGMREFKEPLPDEVIRRKLIAAAKKHLREEKRK